MAMFQDHVHAQAAHSRNQELEKRLGTYYGPALPPHPLPEESWLQVCAQLDCVQRASVRPHHLSWLGSASFKRTRPVPLHLQQVFASVLVQAGSRRSQPVLRYSRVALLHQPHIRTSPLGLGRMHLIVPERQALQELELEILLAVGLARCLGASRALFLLPRLFFACAALFVVATLPLASVERRAFWLLLAALVCCVAGGCLITWQRRSVALRADYQAVQWLGRERVCQGLHLLAEHGGAQSRPAWGEPSLAERIARVCGTPLHSKDRHLTLVV